MRALLGAGDNGGGGVNITPLRGAFGWRPGGDGARIKRVADKYCIAMGNPSEKPPVRVRSMIKFKWVRRFALESKNRNSRYRYS